MCKVFYKSGILQIIPPFVTPPGLLGPGAATVKHRKKQQWQTQALSCFFIQVFQQKLLDPFGSSVYYSRNKQKHPFSKIHVIIVTTPGNLQRGCCYC
jgi:hypothetical protein